jgi:short subunit dehydrogenase-like uncharacterized protein
MTRPFDLIVFGATGFTGRLVAEVLHGAEQAGRLPRGLRWALAGRDAARLAEVRSAIGAGESLALVVADASDAQAVAKLVAQARVVITTVGPYQRHGEALIAACAKAGTDYVDLCGEPAWMAAMIPRLEAPARKSGARIVFSCGFDSIPFDLGVLFLQHHAQQQFGAPLVRVLGGVKKIKGGASGGTVASLLATLEAAGRDRSIGRVMADPFALTPGFSGPPQADSDQATYDDDGRSWTAPFVMAAINTKNVHRTNLLRGHPWGRDFVYSERSLARDEAGARKMARTHRLQTFALGIGPARRAIERFVLPKPGQGPSPEERERGRFELRFVGRSADGRQLGATVTGDRDPGYGSTSKMIVEAALCLAEDVNRTMTPGGVWTPGAAMGMALVRRLEADAGLTFKLEPSKSA